MIDFFLIQVKIPVVRRGKFHLSDKMTLSNAARSFVILIHWHGVAKKFSVPIDTHFRETSVAPLELILFCFTITICCLPARFYLSHWRKLKTYIKSFDNSVYSLLRVVEKNRCSWASDRQRWCIWGNAYSVRESKYFFPILVEVQPRQHKMRCDCESSAYVRLKSRIQQTIFL